MPKQKSHKGAAKRFKVTAGGKVLRRHSLHGHYLTQKTTKRKRKLRKATQVSKAFARAIREMV